MSKKRREEGARRDEMAVVMVVAVAVAIVKIGRWVAGLKDE